MTFEVDGIYYFDSHLASWQRGFFNLITGSNDEFNGSIGGHPEDGEADVGALSTRELNTILEEEK